MVKRYQNKSDASDFTEPGLVTIKQRGQRLLADKTWDEDQLQFDLDQITLKSIVIT